MLEGRLQEKEEEEKEGKEEEEKRRKEEENINISNKVIITTYQSIIT